MPSNIKKIYISIKTKMRHLIKKEEILNYDTEYLLENYNYIPIDLSPQENKQLTSRILSNYDLDRFLRAQKYDYDKALTEIKNGKKESHWIWYIFPQMIGLGKSTMSKVYGIRGRGEAEAYLKNPILKQRLEEVCQAVLDNEKSVYDIFGNDSIKVRSCVLLFNSIEEIPVLKQLIAKYKWN